MSRGIRKPCSESSLEPALPVAAVRTLGGRTMSRQEFVDSALHVPLTISQVGKRPWQKSIGPKGHFSNVSHGFRTRLTFMLGQFAEVLVERGILFRRVAKDQHRPPARPSPPGTGADFRAQTNPVRSNISLDSLIHGLYTNEGMRGLSRSWRCCWL